MNEKNINFVKREGNPANVPECRTIEDFWSDLKAKVMRIIGKLKILRTSITE